MYDNTKIEDNTRSVILYPLKNTYLCFENLELCCSAKTALECEEASASVLELKVEK